jgi:hypothetical protein
LHDARRIEQDRSAIESTQDHDVGVAEPLMNGQPSLNGCLVSSDEVNLDIELLRVPVWFLGEIIEATTQLDKPALVCYPVSSNYSK